MNNYTNYNGTPSGHSSNGQPQHHLTSLPNLASHNYQQDSPASSHTLPPIHTQPNGANPYHNAIYRSAAASSAPHTPRTPHTPGTPVNGASTASLAQIASQPQNGSHHQQHSYLPIVPAMGQQQPMPFSMSASSQNGGPPSSTSYSQMPSMFPQQLPSVYDPSRARTTLPPSSLPPPSHTVGNNIGHMGPGMEQRLAPVVGSQGRRGILPSAPGRPAVPGDGSAARAALNPVNKTPDGKYPCQYCNKTYLHLKHLKRHLLRREYLIVIDISSFH